MIRDLLKWVAPGVVTVLGGTAAALATVTPAMLDNLAEEGRVALSAAGSDWARITLDGRHIHLRGTTASDAERDRAMASLAAVPGVISVDETVTIAPRATPFRINVAVEDGAVSLFGNVPNERVRQELVALPGLAAADLQIRSGQPDEAAWRAGLNFALAQADLVESGHFELSGLTLNAVGRASSERALGALQMALDTLPEGVSAGTIAVEPVTVAPYTWTAEFDGDRIAISGHVPEETLVERLRMADVSGIPVATGLSLASGAPDGFAERSRLLVEQLARLDHGRASIVDGVSRLSGAPPSIQIAQAVTEALSGTGSIVDLDPPPITDYWMSVSRQSGGVLVFDGFVPDEATRAAFADIDQADVSFLKFGAGAPPAYRRAVDFGLDLLTRMSEGRFTLNGNSLAVSGIASSPKDFRDVLAQIETGLPQGVSLGEIAVQAPRAASYAFTASRAANGTITLDGMLPGPTAEFALLAAAGSNAVSRVSYASGEAPDFLASARQALAFLPWLREGTVSFDGTGWLVEGTPASAIDQGAIETEFAVRGLAASGWSLALSAPQAEPVVADPYTWSAERLADGSFLFSGHVPSTALQSWLGVHVEARVADTSRVAVGAPDGFVPQLRAMVDALMVLEQGRVDFDGAAWTLSGSAADAIAREQAIAIASLPGQPLVAEVSAPEPVPPEPYRWAATKSEDGAVRFTGSVPAEALQRFLAVRAGAEAMGETNIRADAPEGFSAQVLQAMDILALLAQGEVAFDGQNWSASGIGIEQGAGESAETLLGTAAPAWTLALSDPAIAEAPAEPVAEAEPAAPAIPATADPVESAPTAPASEADDAPPVVAAPAGLSQCRERVAELSGHNAILFQSGAAIIAAAATPELDAFATALALCPDAVVEVEGHTDSDGDDRLNLALSVARAEAVVNALIERGIAPDRLYAIGYGESQPVADNGTAQGKSRNRRIVVTVRDAAGQG